jgi:hypothetical protein
MGTYGIYENGEVIASFAAPLTVKSNQPISVSDTLSLKRQITKRGAQRWEITTNLEPLSTDAQSLFVNLVTKGFSNSDPVTIVMPQNYGAAKARTTNAALTAYGTQYSSQITVSGFTSGVLPKGTFINFGIGTKVYLTTSDLTANGSLNIFPPLINNVGSSGSPLALSYKNDVLMYCYYDTETLKGMVYTDGILMDAGTVTLIEKL